MVGSESKMKRVSAPPVSSENNKMKSAFHGHVHTIPHPAARAITHKKMETLVWDHEEMALATKEFEIPANTKVLLVHPEWLCHDLCKLEKNWRTASSGVRMPCPSCSCTKHVRNNGWSIQEDKDPRSIATDDDHLRTILVGPKYKCINPQCGGTTDIKTKAAHWTPYAGVGWSSLPADVNDGGATFISPAVADRLLDDEINFTEEVADEYAARYLRFETYCIESYAKFVHGQRCKVARLSTNLALGNQALQGQIHIYIYTKGCIIPILKTTLKVNSLIN